MLVGTSGQLSFIFSPLTRTSGPRHRAITSEKNAHMNMGPLNSQMGFERTLLWGIKHLARHWQLKCVTVKYKGGFVESRGNWLK